MIKFRKTLCVLLVGLFVQLNIMPVFAAGENQKVSMVEPKSETIDYKLEHLPQYKKSSINTVKIKAHEASISEGSVLKITFNSKFNSKTAVEGELIDFTLENGLITQEGTRILPEGTIICGNIQKIDKAKVFNRNAVVYIAFDSIILPDGTKYQFLAYPFHKNKVLKRSSWAAVGKAALWTVGLFGVGAGAGAGIGAAASAVGVGCFAIGMPVGAGVGLLVGVITPGVQYKGKPGKSIYIKLENELILPL